MKQEINQARINYTLSGQGPCLILIHGFSDNLHMWFNQIPEFSKSYQVLAVDARGHGETEVLGGGYELAAMAEDIKGLMDALEIPKYKEVKMKNNPDAYPSIMEGMAAAMAVPPDLSRLSCPALIIAGEQDGFMAMDTAYAMEKTIKDSTLVVFPTGHASAIEVPNEFNQAVLKFLEKIY